MRCAVFALIFILIACTPQEEGSENNTWSFIFSDGTILEFPNAWNFVAYRGYLFNVIYFTDEYSSFYIFQDGRSHAAMEETYIADNQDTLVELEVNGDTRLFRGERVINFEDVELFDGATEFIVYVALVPDDKVFNALFPIAPELEEREKILQEVLLNARPLHPELKTFGFGGGLAVMTYTHDWEIVNWNSADSPVMQGENARLNFFVAHESFYHNMIDNEDDNIPTEAVINFLLTQYLYLEVNDIEPSYRYGQLIYRVGDSFLLILDNGLTFVIYAHYLDSSQPEDEAEVLRMIDSILLNNRSNYYEPINLIIPEGMGE